VSTDVTIHNIVARSFYAILTQKRLNFATWTRFVDQRLECVQLSESFTAASFTVTSDDRRRFRQLLARSTTPYSLYTLF